MSQEENTPQNAPIAAPNVTCPLASGPSVSDYENSAPYLNPDAPVKSANPMNVAFQGYTNGQLLSLLGTWNSSLDHANLTKNGWNVMPLPQVHQNPAGGGGDEATGFDPNVGVGNVITKNFSYFEELTFVGIPGNAPNRGGEYQQNAAPLFYEQRVYFGGGVGENTLVHAENGSWLYLETTTQGQGLNERGEPVFTNVPPQGPLNLLKQVSVPHGNSILAPGSVSAAAVSGLPEISAVSCIPTKDGVPQEQFAPLFQNAKGFPDDQNPNIDPTVVLRTFNDGNPNGVTDHIAYQVDTTNPDGAVTNIPFETKLANVTDYQCSMWLGLKDGVPVQLQYVQTILMEFPDLHPGVVFKHITANNLTPVPPTEQSCPASFSAYPTK